MVLSDVSIKRPVFATMMIGAIVVFGLVLYQRLTVDMFPEVNFPVVTVTTVFPGADPGTMETQVAQPLEEAVNSLSGIRSLRSVSLEGVAQVILEFDLDIAVSDATQEVRDKISTVTLPDGAEAPKVEKIDLGAAPVMQLVVGGDRSKAELASYVETTLEPALERIGGVGQVEVVGSQEREIHVWLRPDALRAEGLTFTDVANVLAAQNVEVPGGRVDAGDAELVVRTDATAASVEELAQVVIGSRGGVPLRLGAVADLEDGVEEARSAARLNGESAIAIVLRKQSDANTVVVADAVREALGELRKSAPAGTELEVLVDNSIRIRGSIETVQLDLILGAFLAVAIIFIFLRDLRATVISALALPTSVIGTFAFVQSMGFTLNMMTTLALSLSIGILIDDAIVVIENIVRRRTALGEGPQEAASRGTAEIGLAVLATTLCIVAVFVPVAFMDGMLGQFFYEFGLTVAFAVLLSLFVSFTLTPMLSARFLKAHHGEPRGLSKLIEGVLTGIENGYRAIIAWALRHRWITMAGAVGALVATFSVVPRIGFEMMPIEDVNQFMTRVELPPGTSLAETDRRVNAVAERIRQIPGVVSTFATVGGGAQEKVNAAEVIVSLVHREKRSFHQTDAMARVRETLAGEPNMLVSVEAIALVSMGARNAPIQLNLRGGDLATLTQAGHQVADQLRKLPGFVDVDVSARAGKPEIEVRFDRLRAADVGVMGRDVARTVRGLIAGEVATRFEADGERYDVRLQLPQADRTSMDRIADAQLRTSQGALVEIRDIGEVLRREGPSQIDREARQRQVTVFASLDGKALGDAVNEVTAIAKTLPPGVEFAFGGNSKMLQESVASMLLALFLAVVCVYMILASQFESFAHPLTIMASLPFSLIGAFGGLLVMDMNMSIFAMIGLIMLMGLVTKNAILLIDFAIQLQKEGKALTEALIEAGAVRLRPILMTTAAMIFGMLPVAIGHGDGGEVRAPMGVCVIGGLITSTVLTLVVVPVIYAMMEGMLRAIGRAWRWITRKGPVEEPAV